MCVLFQLFFLQTVKANKHDKIHRFFFQQIKKSSSKFRWIFSFFPWICGFLWKVAISSSCLRNCTYSLITSAETTQMLLLTFRSFQKKLKKGGKKTVEDWTLMRQKSWVLREQLPEEGAVPRETTDIRVLVMEAPPVTELQLWEAVKIILTDDIGYYDWKLNTVN